MIQVTNCHLFQYLSLLSLSQRPGHSSILQGILKSTAARNKKLCMFNGHMMGIWYVCPCIHVSPCFITQMFNILMKSIMRSQALKAGSPIIIWPMLVHYYTWSLDFLKMAHHLLWYRLHSVFYIVKLCIFF